MRECSIADVLNKVLFIREWCESQPLRPFAAHLGHSHDVADQLVIHDHGHDVTPDAATHEAAFGRPRRGVVGHPEQKYGVRVSRGSSIRARLDRFCHARTGSIAYSLPSLRARAVATLSVSSSPEALSKTCPLGSSLPITRGGFAVPYSMSLIAVSMNARFSSTTMISSSPRAEGADYLGIERIEHANLEQTNTVVAEAVVTDAQCGQLP